MDSHVHSRFHTLNATASQQDKDLPRYPCKQLSSTSFPLSSMSLSLPPNGALMTDQCTDQCVVITCNDPDHVDGISCDSLYAGLSTLEHHRNELSTLMSYTNLRSRGQPDDPCTSKCSVLGDIMQDPGCETDCNIVYTSQSECSECMPAFLDDILELRCCSESYPPSVEGRVPHVSPLELCVTDPGYVWHQTPLGSNVCTNCGCNRSICTGSCLGTSGPKVVSNPLSSQITAELAPVPSYDLKNPSSQSAQTIQDGSQTFTVDSMTNCQWGQCQASFSTYEELIGHVNYHHLSPWEASIQASNETSDSYSSVDMPGLRIENPPGNLSHLSCYWRNCTKHLPVSEPKPRSCPLPYEQWRDLIAVHVFRDHLRLPFDIVSGTSEAPQDSPRKADEPDEPFTSADSRNSELEILYTPPLSPSSSSSTQDPTEGIPTTNTPSPEHLERTPSLPIGMDLDVPATENVVEEVAIPVMSTKSLHKCLWHGCNEVFGTCEELTVHLSEVHVGSGRAIYECFWKGCTRNKGACFGSRQKINRHLQSHTGHRPFQCSVCHQNFSEVATLQQHMRRHTQERPYACDYPGCGKSFAIAGALTIHKRIHNGQRPFKCTHCDRAFAESSNLSKHLRTHTGVKPYSCPEPSCTKSFARPDQLTRHLATHKRKAQSRMIE
ncbi:hypothetical protein AX15_004222 [Amanita polypyramis BW_CC]|nr:hypothetical protein AX15_004222 [Amanita polypyramis BW_CC]